MEEIKHALAFDNLRRSFEVEELAKGFDPPRWGIFYRGQFLGDPRVNPTEGKR